MNVKMLTDEETAFFCEQLAMLLEAGIPLADGMEVLSEDAGDRRFKEIAETLVKTMNDGSTLFDAMDKSEIFPDYAVKMVKIGSVTGRLEDALNGLSDYYSKRSELRQTVKSSVSHPLILLAMMTAVIIVLVIKVIPMFREIFAQFDDSAAEAVENSVSFAYNVGAFVMILLLVVLAVTLVTAVLCRYPRHGGRAKSFLPILSLQEECRNRSQWQMSPMQ
ncbi:MAG: type II secretion system F family protein [Oscillospiraceae bacterium]|nr:type II secretion system F family protein [Oscillospiraceae bacterium]